MGTTVSWIPFFLEIRHYQADHEAIGCYDITDAHRYQWMMSEQSHVDLAH
jgi:hypothetical protein